MCGICGVVVRRDDALDARSLRPMAESLRHRGPDGFGEWIGEASPDAPLRTWLGHRRLKILDLSDHAHQPMAGADGSAVLTYNGEVYNFRELRRELEARGHRFRSTGDTEIVLRAYEEWDEGFLSRIDGMFALAVWDARKNRLLVARDRTGKKPLFYADTPEGFAFGSEIKSVLQCPFVKPARDDNRLAEFLTFGYVPHPRTLYRGIHQVPPGAYVTYGPDGPSEPVEYWSPPAPTPAREHPRDSSEDIAALVDAAVRRRLLADVPLGALLSGGMDSSIVVGLMARALEGPVHTFSIGFPEEPSFDERSAARKVAEHFGTKHTEFAVELDAVGLLDRLVWFHDQPFHDSSAIPTYVVSGLAREHVTVVLNGDGGDEVFGGYDRFRAARLVPRLPSVPARTARRVADALPQGDGYYAFGRRVRRVLEHADAPVQDRYQGWISVFGKDLLPQVLRPEVLAAAECSPETVMTREYARAPAASSLDQIMLGNFRSYLPDDLSVKMDRMSMAHSLEARSPFLDTAVIDFVGRIPASRKVGVRRLKPLLRAAFSDLLPREIFDRRKHGFGVPMGTWFRGELGEFFKDEVLSRDARSAEVLQRNALERLYREHLAGEQEHGARLWTVLTLERWLRSLEAPPSVGPPVGGVRGAVAN